MKDTAQDKVDTVIEESEKAFKAEDSRRDTLEKKSREDFRNDYPSGGLSFGRYRGIRLLGDGLSVPG